MYHKNGDRILALLTPTDIVLDIGGWAEPFNRANYVLDVMPYETRGIFGSIGPKPECFSKDTWIVQDVCNKTGLPFGDKEIAFVICSHVLEDIRDPIFLCSELVRVARRGYIEVPSRVRESIVGLEGRRYPGYYHHRWLVEIVGPKVIFRHKTALMAQSWKYHLPASYNRRVGEDERYSYLFWEGEFEYEEVIKISMRQVGDELEEFVRSRQAYPDFFYTLDAVRNGLRAKSLLKRALRGFPRIKRFAEKLRGRPIGQWDEQEKFWQGVQDFRSNSRQFPP